MQWWFNESLTQEVLHCTLRFPTFCILFCFKNSWIFFSLKNLTLSFMPNYRPQKLNRTNEGCARDSFRGQFQCYIYIVTSPTGQQWRLWIPLCPLYWKAHLKPLLRWKCKMWVEPCLSKAVELKFLYGQNILMSNEGKFPTRFIFSTGFLCNQSTTAWRPHKSKQCWKSFCCLVAWDVLWLTICPSDTLKQVTL